MTPVEAEDQDFASEACNAVSSQLRGKAGLQDVAIERLRDNEKKSEKSLGWVSRLLFDEIVDNLSRHGRKEGA